MNGCVRAGYLLVIVAAGAVGAVRDAAAQGRSPATVIKSAREFLRSQRFDGALKQLQELKNPGERTAEVATLEATAWLGKALQADLSASEGIHAIHIAGAVKHGMISLADQAENAPFAKEVEGEVLAYLKQASQLAAAWPTRFKGVLQGFEQARNSARNAYELERSATPRRDEAAILWVWADLSEYLAVREVHGATLRADTAEVFPPEVMEAIRQTLPRERQLTSAETRLKTTLSRLMAEVGQSRSTALALALAECDVLYAAARERFFTDRFRSAKTRFSPTARTPLPPAADMAPLAGPLALLSVKSIEERLPSEPETLILPLYQVAARDEKSRAALAASYGLFFALLAHNEREAGRVLEGMLNRHPGTPALLLEQARYASIQREGAGIAQAAYRAAFQAGPLRRPVFVSLPEELQQLWQSSRPATGLGPHFFWTLTPMANSRVLSPPAAGQPRDPTALPLRQLQLAEMLMKGNLRADVVDGIWAAEAALARLKAAQLPDEVSAQANAYLDRLQVITAGVPASLVRPHRTFSTYETLTGGERRPTRTLTISPTGFVGFGRFAPGS